MGYGELPPRASMGAYWRCEDLTDVSGNGHTLTNAGTTIVAGKFNKGIQTANNNQSAYVVSNCSYTGGVLTMSFWFKYATTTNTEAHLIDVRESTHNTSFQLFYRTDLNRLSWYRSKYGIGAESTYTSITLPSTSFTHICCTYDNTSLRMYINGVLTAGPTAASGYSAVGYNDRLDLGAWDGNVIYAINGIFDDIIVEARVWTPAEIRRYYGRAVSKTQSVVV